MATYQSLNDACKRNQHQFRQTTSNNFRQCAYGCGAIEQRQGEDWVRVDVEKKKQTRKSKQQAGSTLYDMFGGMEVKQGEQQAKDIRNYWS
jgi:hypothetical protein